ncbi:MAG TPA: conjugal transfer protein TraG [Lachnospiraceae bacterium]|nr:conjugal transfer protein TraG [Lachnospiraceae bacterium]
MFLLAVIPFYLGTIGGYAYFHCEEKDINAKLQAVSSAYEALEFNIDLKSALVGGVCAFFYSLAVIYKIFNNKVTMPGMEHGSANWGKAEDIAKYKDSKFANNMLFTQTERMSLNTRKTMRNNNVLVIGGSGSGKTRFFIKPNLLQLHSSYVVTDPKGTVLNEVGKVLADNGYKIKVFNTVDFSKSMRYNPFTFIKSEADIKVFVDILITSTKEKGEKSGDAFWENSERLLYMALIGYIWYELDEEEQNFTSLLRMINSMEVRENDETFQNCIDLAFEELEIGTNAFNEKHNITPNPNDKTIEAQPEHFAVSQYKKYKLAAGKTAKSILISCGVRLSAFDIKEVREMTTEDEMVLSALGEEKTALFIIIDDKVSTFNFLANMMYSQLFKELCDKADNKYHGRLPIHVRCLLDEFANIGQIPNFEKIISIIRSREISVDVIVQNMAQIEALYDKQAGTIVGNCDTTLFLGSGENSTMKNISERVGKATISHKSSSTTKGQQGSYSLQNQILGRELITPDEVGRLDNGECILFIRGLKPFKSKKYDYKHHPKYKKTGDYKKEFLFNFEDIERKKEENKDLNIDEYILKDDDLEIIENKRLLQSETEL